jgi:beta-galactosidase
VEWRPHLCAYVFLITWRIARRFGGRGLAVAIMPSDEAFAHAAVWKIQVPSGGANPPVRLLLGIDYVGDIARVYAGDRFVTDDFYHLEIGLWRTGRDLELRVLPLRGDAPIYLPAGARIPAGAVAVELKSVKVIPEYETTLRIR